MKMFSLILPALVLIALAGCNKPTPTVTGTPATAATQSPAAPVPADVPSTLSPADIDFNFKVVDGPSYDPATDMVMYQLQVANNGKVTLTSAGERAVNLGVVIRGSDGTLATPPANQDFMRVELSQPLAPGQTVMLPVAFAAEPTLGGTVVVDAVQESVSWFSGYGKPVLTLGAFSRCKAAAKTLCREDGTQIPAAQ